LTPLRLFHLAGLLRRVMRADTASLEQATGLLVLLGPTYVKLGQVLATRPDLVGPEIARAFSRLHDSMPPFDHDAAIAVIESELGRKIDALYQDFEPAIAAASIAQVHFARSDTGKVAVKVLRPGIEAAMRRDLADLSRAAHLAEFFSAEARRLRLKEIVALLERAIALELDLRMEAAAADELAEHWLDDPDFRVPKVDWRRTARRVLTLERVAGLPLSNIDAVVKAHSAPDIAQRLVKSFLRQAMIQGFFHADLHPGNLFIAPDGALVAVDFGIMGRLDAPNSRFLALILKGFVERDYRSLARLHFDAGFVPKTHDVEDFAQALRAIGEPIFDRPAADISMGRVLTQLFDVTRQFGMPAQPQLLLLQKTMVVVEGVARQLDPSLNMFETARPVVEEWLAVNLGPAAALSRGLAEMPALLERLRLAAENLGVDGLRLHPDSLRALAREQANIGRPQRLALGLAALALVLAAAALLF